MLWVGVRVCVCVCVKETTERGKKNREKLGEYEISTKTLSFLCVLF
jgi:hypothetical protein